MRLAVDWDSTLVDVHSKDWLPGALHALNGFLRQGHVVVIHSCRANWPEGRAEIAAALEGERLLRRVTIVGKPDADLYIDDKARLPEWRALLRETRPRRST